MSRLAIAAVSVCLAGCTGASPLFPFEDFLPSEAEFEAFNERVDALPVVTIRITNETDTIVRANLSSGLSAPDLYGDGFFDPFGEEYLELVDSLSVLIAPNGSVEGTLRCGDVIGITSDAPFDGFDLYIANSAFGLYLGSGNVVFTGIGVATDESVSGDTISFARFVRPDADNLDCNTQAIVIHIQTPGRRLVSHPDTGELISGLQFGTGTVNLE